MSTRDLVAKLWNLCNLLRDDGVTYHEYINELTYLVFLKMAAETDTEDGRTEKEMTRKLKKNEKRKSPNIPEGCRWKDLESHNSATRLDAYKNMLLKLATDGSLLTQAIFTNSSTVIRKPATLTSLVTEIEKLDWYEAKEEGLGDMYEGLLEINATEKKSGAGQYFTPRVLINAMVELMKPNLDDVIVDPTAGTGGFLISAHHYLSSKNKVDTLDEAAYEKYQHKTFYGMELVPDTRRLAMMNLMLHDLSVSEKNQGVLYGDALSNEGKALPAASLILANPPFGTKQGGGVPTRDDLVHYSSNKQLAFLHLIYHVMLRPGGRAAVVLPDNVLFEDSAGKTIRQDLMNKCNVHTILRLPTGIFYAAGVKTNVLFFNKPKDPNKDKGNTKKVWFYDLRTNMPQFGKRTVFTSTHFEEFYKAIGNDLTKVNGNLREKYVADSGAECRLQCFTRKEIEQRGDNLDISWLKDEGATSGEDLEEPEVIAAMIREKLGEALGEIEVLEGLLEGNVVEVNP